jgi:hypothetical protein
MLSTFEQYNEDSDDEDEDADKAAAQPESLEVLPYSFTVSFWHCQQCRILSSHI